MAVKTLPIGPGTLTIGSDLSLTHLESQVTEATLTPKVDNDDPIPVLSGEEVAGDRSETWTLEGTMLQDFGEADSVTEWLFTHAGETHPFAFVPNSSKVRQITGNLQVEATAIGGKARSKAEADFEFVVIGRPVVGAIAG